MFSMRAVYLAGLLICTRRWLASLMLQLGPRSRLARRGRTGTSPRSRVWRPTPKGDGRALPEEGRQGAAGVAPERMPLASHASNGEPARPLHPRFGGDFLGWV